MRCYKLEEFTLSTRKFEKSKFFDGQSDIERKFNPGFVEIRNLLDYLSSLFDQVGVSVNILYQDQKINYYLEMEQEVCGKMQNFSTEHSSWNLTKLPPFPNNVTKTITGACHISTSDETELNLIDEIVRYHKNDDFMLSYSFILRRHSHKYNILIPALEKQIIKLHRTKEIQESKPRLKNPLAQRSVEYIDVSEEIQYLYLRELYHLYRSSSAFCENPTLRIFTADKSVANGIASAVEKRSRSKNAYYFKYWFEKELNIYQELQRVFTQSDAKSIIEKGDHDENLFQRNFLFTQVVPSSFIAASVGLSNTKIPGIVYLDEYEYGSIGEPEEAQHDAVKLGRLNKTFQTDIPVLVDYDDLTMHTLVTGVTGSGKTTTIKSILSELYDNKLPFLVLEPAKTEYKSLNVRGLKRYLLGIETEDCLRINPFEFPYRKDSTTGIHLQTHLDLLKSIFIAAFSMYGPMPYVLETAFYYIYQRYGWDFKSGHNIYWDNTKVKSDLFPTLDDLYNAIDHIVSIQGYSLDFKNDLTAALKVRIGSLKSGAKGTMLNTKSGTSIGELLSSPTVIELERIGDAQEKVFIMGLLLVSIYEHYIAQGSESEGKLKHLLVIEEAHRLLENVQQNNNNEIADMKGKALETFNNILSEIRAYGQGIVVADQIPTKISPDVIKNTNLKIIHRLFAQDDRDAVGDAIGLNKLQKKGLIHLKTGEAIVFHAKLTNAVKIMANPKGLEKGTHPSTISSSDLDTLDIITSTSAIYSEVKKLFSSAVIFNWNYKVLTEKMVAILNRYSIAQDEGLIESLISALVHWFALKLRNNLHIPYDFPKEIEVNQYREQPKNAIEGIRTIIAKNGHNLHFPIALEDNLVENLDYFIYVYTEDRKTISNIVLEIRNHRKENFKFFDKETQSWLFSVSKLEDYVCLNELSDAEKVELAQCLVYYSSYAHTGFEYYFEPPYKQISDEKYLEYLKLSEQEQAESPVPIAATSTNLEPFLSDIAMSLKELGQKQETTPDLLKNIFRLPMILSVVNILFIIIAVLYIIIR